MRINTGMNRMLEAFVCSNRLTFRNANLLAAVLTVFSLVFLVMLKVGVIAPRSKHPYPTLEAVSQNPVAIVCYNILAVLGFWIIFRTRHNRQCYRVRVFLCGMLLGGVVGELLNFLGRRVLHVL
jgi:ABC-type nickel/cobalt efflux system permease component RcnA